MGESSGPVQSNRPDDVREDVPATGADISDDAAVPVDTVLGDTATTDRARTETVATGDVGSDPTPGEATPTEAVLDDAVHSLRALILAGERYRQAISASIGLGTTESQAISYLALHGDRGQSDLARDLRLTSSASTALVDRLERQGVAERTRHPRDRRRTLVRLTERGQSIAAESQEWLVHALLRIDDEGLELVSTALAVIAGDLTQVARKVVTGEVDAGPTHALPAA